MFTLTTTERNKLTTNDKNMKTQYINRLMNHDSISKGVNPKFESLNLEELNNLTGENYTSLEEAHQADPEYLFDDEEMADFLKEI